MEFINNTPFNPALITGRYNFPKHSLTFIIKGTFDLKQGENAAISEEQLFPTGDEFYPEDEEMIGGPRYPSDFAYFKPKTDLLLAGKCYSSEGKKNSTINVKFQASSKAKTLTIYGNRYWISENTFTNPESFSEMEIRYENSFGGNEYKKNPVGKGLDKVEIKTGDKLIPLPNILNFGENSSGQKIKLEPAGFGAYGQMWTQRFSKIGSYKGNYIKERWPWFSKDFDWGYFNSSPEDMQLNGYLKGDEKLYFENLHPVHSKYHSQLPRIRVRCFINEFYENKSENIIKNFKEVKLNLDTLWANVENEKLVLVWRGISDIKTEEYEEIEHIFIVSENLNEPPKSLEHYKILLEKEISAPKEEEIFKPEPVEASNEKDLEMEAEMAKAEEQMRASLIEAGIDPDNPPEPSEEDKKRESEILKGLGFEEEPKEFTLTRELIIERAAKKESFAGEDLRGIDFSELDLQNLNFQNTIISEVSFKNSNLSGSDFTGANLSGANLSTVKLLNANLKDTDFSGSLLINADLTASIMEGTIFEKANLQNALLDNVKGSNSFFSEADLRNASLNNSEFIGADFSKSLLDKSDFTESNLSEASFENASCKEINLSRTNLTKLKATGGIFQQGIFKNSAGNDITWVGSDFSEADFSFSKMESADFTSAIMQKTNLYAAYMKFARFTKANLTGAILKKMNLFQGSLEKANLTKADCSGSNFYAVEFLDVIIKDTRFQFTNLKMTKLFK